MQSKTQKEKQKENQKEKQKEKQKENVRLTHTFGPWYDENSRYLFLGSFPSVKSREEGFFYGHPRNRFWKVIAAVFEDVAPETIEEKKAFLTRNHIALYDVIESCTIHGSSDSSIRDAEVTNLAPILETGHIENRIFVNGNKAYELYCKYTLPVTGIKAVKLPSTSPANAAWSLERLTETWRETVRGSD